MGRPKTPIVVDGPAATFAEELRHARLSAQCPSYRQMGELARWSHNGLAQADRGHRLPTWACTKAYLQGCGVHDETEIQTWRRKWESARRAIQLRNELNLLRAPADTRRRRLAGVRRLDLPQLRDASTTEHLVDALRTAIEQRSHTVETIQETLNDPSPVLPDNTPRVEPHMLREVLAGHAPLTLTLMLRVLVACGGTPDDLNYWYQTWLKISAAEERAREALEDLKRQAEQILKLQQAVVGEPKDIELQHRVLIQARELADALLKATRMTSRAVAGRSTSKYNDHPLFSPPTPDVRRDTQTTHDDHRPLPPTTQDEQGSHPRPPRGHVGKHRQDRDRDRAQRSGGPSARGTLFGLAALFTP